VAGARLQQQHRNTKTGIKTTGTKNSWPSWNVCSKQHDYDVLTKMRRWAACITSNVGITSCRSR
jgi:hypothetical protein